MPSIDEVLALRDRTEEKYRASLVNITNVMGGFAVVGLIGQFFEKTATTVSGLIIAIIWIAVRIDKFEADKKWKNLTIQATKSTE